jgi:5'-nucleotidase/UDP-sugar diphosphatase
MSRRLDRITATTDVHSQLDAIGPLLAHLDRQQPTSLIVDCGDFFEGTGFYALGHGEVERSLLLALYDVVAAGNHGWHHHFAPDLHRITVCANAVDAATGDPLFRRVHHAVIAGRRVAVTAVIGEQAFNAIPLAQRRGQAVTDPAAALWRLFLNLRHETDAWILLSHSGFEHDLALADVCDFLDVVFAGHCHSPHYEPEPVGDTLVVKGAELAAGYATAEPVGHGWAARTGLLPHTDRPPDSLATFTRIIDQLQAQLSAPIAPLADRWRNRTPDRRTLLREVAQQLHAGAGNPVVVLNETVLRPGPLGEDLTSGDLLAVVPFGNQLVQAPLPEVLTADLPVLFTHLADRAGPLVITPDPAPAEVRSVLTTDYLAETLLDGRARPSRTALAQVVRHVLTSDQPEGDPQ